MRWSQVWFVAKVDLLRLFKSKDYWIPLLILASLFFVIVPAITLFVVGAIDSTGYIEEVGSIIATLPDYIEEKIRGDTPGVRASYAFAVYLLAPIAIIVPLTISSAVGANTMVGERERGTGEFLAHSPLSVKEIYTGKLIASLIPGYLATFFGFAAYSLVVNLIVGTRLGGWFFPTAGWILLIVWVVPPFIAIALAIILRLSARVKSAAAAQQASSLVTLPVIIASYGIASGLLFSPGVSAIAVGAAAWVLAVVLLLTGARALRRERLLGVASET